MHEFPIAMGERMFIFFIPFSSSFSLFVRHMMLMSMVPGQSVRVQCFISLFHTEHTIDDFPTVY